MDVWRYNVKTLGHLKKHLRPGQVYRRADLEKWSKAVDRHLGQLVAEGTLEKLSPGVYHYPQPSAFGATPPDDESLVKTFLKDDRFLLTSPNAYNALGVGTTQLYNERVVYNHKRHGLFKLGGRTFHFRMKPFFPKDLSPEFLLVDLVNNLNMLAEDREMVLEKVREKALSMDRRRLRRAVGEYAGARARKFFDMTLDGDTLSHAA